MLSQVTNSAKVCVLFMNRTYAACSTGRREYTPASPKRGISVITDTEIKMKGIQLLSQHLGDVEAERFIALIQREPFDYTTWRQGMDEELSITEISRRAMSLKSKSKDA